MVDIAKIGHTANQGWQASPNPPSQVGFTPNAKGAGQPQPEPNPAPNNTQQSKVQVPTKEDLQKQLELVNKVVGGLNVNLSFGVLQSTGNLYVQVKDNNTGKTIKVLPSVDYLRLQDKLNGQVKGFLENRLA